MLRIKFIVFTIISLMCSLFGFGQQPALPDTIQPAAVLQPAIQTASSDHTMSVIMSGLEDILIPVVGIIVPFLAGFLMIFFILKYQYNKKKEKYAVVMKALEMGKDLPAEFFQEPKKAHSPLEAALTLIAVGIGLGVMGFFLKPIFYGIGVICLLVGIAKFIAWKIETKKETGAADLKTDSTDRPNE